MVDINPESEEPEAKCILDFTEKRIKKKLACMMLFCGELGKGKSYAGLRFLEMWYEQMFNEPFPIKNVCENLEQAILLVKDFKRKGEGIMIEELSVLASARDSLSRMNKLFNKFLDTCRIKQAVIVANAPHISFIDKHFILLTQIRVEILGVNFQKNICVGKALMIQPSQYRTEPYTHNFVGDDGFPINMIYFKKPSENICKAYDDLKMNSTNDLYKELADKMKREKEKDLKELKEKETTDNEQQAWDLKLEGKSPKEIAKIMDYTDYRAINSLLRSYRRKKGIKRGVKNENQQIATKSLENRGFGVYKP